MNLLLLSDRGGWNQGSRNAPVKPACQKQQRQHMIGAAAAVILYTFIL
ncbi:hypothetical protein [Pontibacter mucosus]|nr:hypothetical protein [Pontibacter mucosus]